MHEREIFLMQLRKEKSQKKKPRKKLDAIRKRKWQKKVIAKRPQRPKKPEISEEIKAKIDQVKNQKKLFTRK